MTYTVGMDDELSQTGKSVLWFIGMNLLVHYTITKAYIYIYIYIYIYTMAQEREIKGQVCSADEG